MFKVTYDRLARDLADKTLKVGTVEVQILQAEGYPRRENVRAPYTPVLTMDAGRVLCPKHRGALLVLIACQDGDGAGGCVLLRKIMKDGRVVNGPGRVAEALGITDADTRGSLSVKGDKIVLTIDGKKAA